MGVLVKAAIVVSAASAIYGLAKLRSMASKSAEGMDTLSDATKRHGDMSDNEWRKYIRNLNTARAVERATAKEAKAARASKPINRPSPDGEVPKPSWVRDPRARFVNEAAGVLHSIRVKHRPIKKTQRPLMERAFGVETDHLTYKQRNLKLMISGINLLSRVSYETRGWWKLLFGSGARGGVKSTVSAVKTAASSIKRTMTGLSGGLSTLSALLASTMYSFGGTRMMGGASSFLTRALNLAREREDSMVTFNTLLGSTAKSEDLVSRVAKYASITPFTTTDLTEASRRLLKLSGRDVDKNEELYKLAAQIAALSPGRSVADAAQGLTQASMGEFEILKGFMFKLSADKMKGAGTAGGKEYTEAMLKEVQNQLHSMTGGGDLVLALSGTMSGLMSTVKDSIDQPLRLVGQSLIDRLGIKDALSGYLTIAASFGDAFAAAMKGDPIPEGTSEGVRVLVELAIESIDRIVVAVKYVKDAFKVVYGWFKSQSPDMQKMIIKIGSAIATVTAVAGLVVPVILAAVVLLSGPIGVLLGMSTAILYALAGLAVVMVGVTIAFALFRKQGESVTDTLRRFWNITVDVFKSLYYGGKIVLMGLWSVLYTHLQPAWDKLQGSLGRVREAITSVLQGFSGAGLTAVELAAIGRGLGHVLGFLLDSAVWLVDLGLRAIAFALEYLGVPIKNTISDFKIMAKTFIGIFTGKVSIISGVKTILKGVADLFITFFAQVIGTMLNAVALGIEQIAGFALLPDAVSSRINEAADAIRRGSDSLRSTEGLLKTRSGSLFDEAPITVKSEVVIPSLKMELNLDGQKVAENQARVEMRSRNSGRGGDPMSPEEMGFVLTGGGIRTVKLTEISATTG